VAAETANRYELSGADTHVACSTTGVDGRPQLSYSGPKGDHAFTGDDVDVTSGALGTEATVTLESVPDLHVLTLTVLLPDVRVERGGAQPLKTIAIYTANFSAIGAPPAVGQSYEVVALDGVATVVER